MSGGKKKKAVAMYRKMLQWRNENGIGREGGKEGVREVPWSLWTMNELGFS